MRLFSTKIYPLPSPHPSTFITLDFFRILLRHAVLAHLSVYFGLASRFILPLLGPHHARFFLEIYPHPLVTRARDAIYERALTRLSFLCLCLCCDTTQIYVHRILSSFSLAPINITDTARPCQKFADKHALSCSLLISIIAHPNGPHRAHVRYRANTKSVMILTRFSYFCQENSFTVYNLKKKTVHLLRHDTI